MKLIKLNAIDSTNSFLKELAQNSTLENFTVVTTNKQTKGRGQEDKKWISEPFKNLIISVSIKFNDFEIDHKKYLNFAISLAIYDVLSNNKVPNLSIKWPNDILSAKKKICGILIENTFTGNKIKNSIVGIGLNVNQIYFPETLKNVTSLKIETQINYDLEILLQTLISKIKEKIEFLKTKEFRVLENSYLDLLYKRNIPSMFKDKEGSLFMGIICGVSEEGNLQIMLEDDSIKEFGIKEITFV